MLTTLILMISSAAISSILTMYILNKKEKPVVSSTEAIKQVNTAILGIYDETNNEKDHYYAQIIFEATKLIHASYEEFLYLADTKMITTIYKLYRSEKVDKEVNYALWGFLMALKYDIQKNVYGSRYIKNGELIFVHPDDINRK